MTTEERVVKIFKDNVGDSITSTDLDVNKPLKEMSFIDSLTVLDILVALEKEFEVSFDLENLDDVFIDIQSITNYIVFHQKNK